jgi:hypothetical protein
MYGSTILLLSRRLIPKKLQNIATVAEIISLDSGPFRRRLGEDSPGYSSGSEAGLPQALIFWLRRFKVSRLRPGVVFTAVLGFLVLTSASSIAQVAPNRHSNATAVAFSQPIWHLQNHLPGLWFEPLWNNGDWQNKPPVRKLPPTHVPEGGSTAVYLCLTGFACLGALARKRRQAPE